MKIILSSCFILFVLSCFAQTKVTFTLGNLPVIHQQQIGIRGDLTPLSWNSSVEMEKTGEQYQVTFEFPTATEEIQYKFVMFDEKRGVQWEGIENRVLSLKNKEEINVAHQWDMEQMIDIAALPKLQPKQLLEDFKLIETMILEVHPGTYRYNDEESIRTALDELKAKFQQPMTYAEAYLAMSKVIAQVKCGHTQVGVFNQKSIINSIIHRQADKLPFAFTWIGNQMIVTYNASDSKALTRGTEILNINGISTQEIQSKMLWHIASDGTSNNNRYALMAVDGYDFEYFAFDVFYPLLFPFDGKEVELEIRNYGSDNVDKVNVSTLTREKRAQNLIELYPNFPRTRDDMWKFEITEDRIAILTLNSFAAFGWKKLQLDYKMYLADVFRQLKEEKVEYLVLDIRGNAGGNDEIKKELFTYFDFDFDEDAKKYERIGKTRYLEFPKFLKPYVQTWGENPWYFNLKPDQIDKANGYYLFKDNYVSQYQERKEDVFKGKLYLLTSGLNASLTYYLAADFKQKKLGTIIGQTTGGNQRDINGGQILFLRLPNSNIEIDFPVMGAFSLAERPDKGIVPDVEVQPTIESIYENIDLEMKYTLKLIREK